MCIYQPYDLLVVYQKITQEARKMRKKKNITGTCALCNAQNIKLIPEHIFPGLKHNHPKPFQVKIKDKISIPIMETQQSRNFQELSRAGLVIHEQGGPKEYSLCKKCNNTTGSWYGNAYIDWKKTVGSDCKF